MNFVMLHFKMATKFNCKLGRQLSVSRISCTQQPAGYTESFGSSQCFKKALAFIPFMVFITAPLDTLLRRQSFTVAPIST